MRSCAPTPGVVTQKSIRVPRTVRKMLRCLSECVIGVRLDPAMAAVRHPSPNLTEWWPTPQEVLVEEYQPRRAPRKGLSRLFAPPVPQDRFRLLAECPCDYWYPNYS